MATKIQSIFFIDFSGHLGSVVVTCNISKLMPPTMHNSICSYSKPFPIRLTFESMKVVYLRDGLISES